MKRLSTVMVVATALCCCTWQAAADPDSSDFPTPGQFADEPVESAQNKGVDDTTFVKDGGFGKDGADNDEFPEPGQYVPAAESTDYNGEPPHDATRADGGGLSKETVDAVWSLADENGDGRATDKEIFAGRRGVRRLANSPVPSTVRDELVKAFDANGSGQLETDEAVVCLSTVRGQRCPIAARARAYWASLDTDHNGVVEPAEFRAVLAPLGNVGRAMAGMLEGTVDAIDRDDNMRVDELEVHRRANAMLLIKLATTGERIAQRNPAQWIQYVGTAANFDIDADNGISPQESRAHRRLASLYGKIDGNRDQSVTVTELYDYKEHLNAVAAAYARAAAAARFSSGGC